MAERKKRIERLRKDLGDLNVSDDALFIVSEIVSEIRDSRNILLWALGILFGILIGVNLAILIRVYG